MNVNNLKHLLGEVEKQVTSLCSKLIKEKQSLDQNQDLKYYLKYYDQLKLEIKELEDDQN